MIVIVDYGMGNVSSVLKAFKRLGVQAIVSSKKEDLEKASKIVLPGVGHFKKGMENLREFGLLDILKKKVLTDKTPLLGICLGMQLLTSHSEEGDSEGIGLIEAETKKFEVNGSLKIPHMGWNNLEVVIENPLFKGILKKDSFYFVHSFFVDSVENSVSSKTNYGGNFVSAIQKENIFGVQFHPEKSYESGLKVLKNFVENV